MSKSLPTFLSRKLHDKNLDLLAVIHELNDVFTEAGYPLELDRLSTATWVNIPKSHGVHGMCWLMESGEVSIFVDERFKGEGMWHELRRLVAHECVHFVQYQAFSESQDEFYLDEHVGKGGRGLGYLKGHAEFFHDVAAEVNSLEPSLNITPLHVGFGDDSTLANKTFVAVVDYQREVWPLGKEHSELKSFEAAFAGKALDEDSLLNSIYEKYGAAATFLRVFETLSPVAESLPSLSSSSGIKGTSSYLGDYSSLISKIKSHSTTEVISERAIRASRGKRLELAIVDVEAKGDDGAQVVFYSTEPLDVYKVLLEVVPFFGGKVSGVSHYLTENLSAEKSHKLTKGGAIRKNQKFTGHREDFVKGLIEHPSSKLIAKIGEAEICARFIEKGFDSKTTSLDKANHSFNLVKHVVKHLKSFPVIGDKVLSKDAAKRIAEVITKESQYIPKALQERIMGGWEALNIKDFPELTLELSFALDGYSVGETDLSEVFRALDNLHYRFGDYRHNSNKDFVEDAVKAAGFKGTIPVDFYNWEPDMEWLGEKITVENQSRINGAVNAGWGERELVEDMFNIEASLRFTDHCEEASLKFEDLLSSVVNGGASPDVTSERSLNSQTPQMSLGF